MAKRSHHRNYKETTRYNHFVRRNECYFNWLIAILSKYLKIEVILGHGLYGNEKLFKKFLRITFLNLADKHLLYGKRAREIMIKMD